MSGKIQWRAVCGLHFIKDKKEILKKVNKIKYYIINYICADKVGTDLLRKMNEYLLPDIIVIKDPIPVALPFYYKNNFKSDITKRKTNCTEGPMLFKLLNCEFNNIHGKLLNKILFTLLYKLFIFLCFTIHICTLYIQVLMFGRLKKCC